MKVRPSYKLPDGKVTVSFKRYLKEWGSISSELENMLDLELIGFDPCFQFRPRNKFGGSVEIPTWLAKRIVALKENK